MNALVVEDSPTMRRVVIGVIIKALPQAKVIEASDGKEAWDILKLEEVDIVLSDWIMPLMSGIELIRSIRADLRLKKLPFIMVTTKGMKEDIIQAIRSGVTDYCVKPIKPAVLENKIKNALEKTG